MGSSEGEHSVYALDLVFAALENADVDPRRRKIVWDDGKRLSIEQSAERIHAEHPDVPRDLIETHVVGGSRALRRNPTPNASSRSSTGSPSSGLTTTSASHRPPGSNPELGTLEKEGTMRNIVLVVTIGTLVSLVGCGTTPIVGALAGPPGVVGGALIGGGAGAVTGAATSPSDVNLGKPVWK